MQTCFSCMREFETGKDACPICGYKNDTPPAFSNCLKPGSVIAGRYLTGKALNHNKTDFTYIALDSSLGKKVAVHEFFPEEFANREPGHTIVHTEEFKDSFNEAKNRLIERCETLRELDYFESIIKVFDIVEDHGTVCIVTELPEGKTLRETIKKEGQYSYKKAVSVILPIMRTLTGLHGANCVHGAINPDNIFITKNNKIKLLGSFTDKIRDDCLVPGYVSAEEYNHPENPSFEDDIYSVCASLYYVLTGVTPTDSKIRNTPSDDFSPLCGYGDIPPEAEDTIMKGMALKPENRPSNAENIICSLLGEDKEETFFFIPETVEEPEPEIFIPEPAKKKNSVPLSAIIVASIGVLLMIVAGIVLIPSLTKKSNQDEPDTTQSIEYYDNDNSGESFLLPAEAKAKYDEFFSFDSFKDNYPEASAIIRRNIDYYPEGKKVPGDLISLEFAQYKCEYCDLDRDGSNECILITDTNGKQRFVSLYIFDIDENGNVFEGGRIEYSDREEEITLCTSRGNKSTAYFFLRTSDMIEGINPSAFEILCYNGKELFCAGSGGAYSGSLDVALMEGQTTDYCYTGLPVNAKGAICNTLNPSHVPSIYPYTSMNSPESADEVFASYPDEFSSIKRVSVDIAQRKLLLRTELTVYNSISFTVSFPGMNMSGKEVELFWRTGNEVTPFLYLADGGSITYRKTLPKKEFRSAFTVELWYGSYRYCTCEISLDETGNPVYNLGNTELARLPVLKGQPRDSAIAELKNNGFTNVTAVKGSRLGVAQIVGNINRIQKQSAEGDNYYPKDTEIKLWYFYF